MAQVDNTANEVETIANEILSAPYAETFRESVSILPPADRTLLSSNPQVLNGLKQDFEQGIAQRIMPLAHRYITVNGMDFLSAYQKAGNEVMSKNSRANDTIKAQPEATTSVSTQKPTDVWSMDSDTFKKLMNNTRQ
jgi:formate dehydrogenase maturation protein FdhE